jgi:hypothetical protein
MPQAGEGAAPSLPNFGTDSAQARNSRHAWSTFIFMREKKRSNDQLQFVTTKVLR